MSYFSISECCITDDPVPQDVADKILRHIDTLNPVRAELGEAVFISGRSGYRSSEYERFKGRSGKSEHCFLEGSDGAVDVTTRDVMLVELGELLKGSGYTRVCWYPDDGFYHCDFKFKKLQLYISRAGVWKRVNGW